MCMINKRKTNAFPEWLHWVSQVWSFSWGRFVNTISSSLALINSKSFTIQVSVLIQHVRRDSLTSRQVHSKRSYKLTRTGQFSLTGYTGCSTLPPVTFRPSPVRPSPVPRCNNDFYPNCMVWIIGLGAFTWPFSNVPSHFLLHCEQHLINIINVI